MQAFPCGLKLKCWRTSTPSPPGCPAPSSRFQPRMKSSSESGCVLSLETAECPEPLCPWRALPAHGATSRVASEDITPPSSLIRAHASDQVPPGASVVPRTPGPCRLSPVPAGGWPFPTLSLQSLRRRLDPYPAASLECTCPFLPREHRPHATEDAFGTRNCPCNATSTGSRISGLQSFVYLQAPTPRWCIDPRAANTAATRRLHGPIANEAGRPSSVMRFKMLHAMAASVSWAMGCRARSRPPMIDLYRKKAFSTRACRW